MSVEQKVRTYILQNFLFTDEESALNSADSLLGKGIIDSTGALELVYFLEEQFRVKVEDREMVPENLDSVNHILAFLAKKQATIS
jgi:acyl carrier protein